MMHTIPIRQDGGHSRHLVSLYQFIYVFVMIYAGGCVPPRGYFATCVRTPLQYAAPPSVHGIYVAFPYVFIMKKIVSIDPRRCKSCRLCIRACPRHCLEISQNRNAAGYLTIELVNPDNCIGCGSCVRTCPEPQCLQLAISN